MHLFAPSAHQVELEMDGQKIAMKKKEGGFWTAPKMHPGAMYAFYTDGKGPFPDPRSPFQPLGVNGPSKWVDQSSFIWHDSNWKQPPIESAILYELHVGTFTPEGTFKALLNKLDYLMDLGVTHLEFMPIAEFSGNWGWGYDGASLFAPHHAYGTPEELKRLIDTCHQKGLALILDVVYNHLGPVGNYLSRFGPYFTSRYATPWGDAINMDGAASDPVRRFFIDNALMWLKDYHFDGLRLDAVHAILDTSAIHFLEQLSTEVKQLEKELHKEFILIAESDLNDPRTILAVEKGGYGIDAQWNEDFHHALHAYLTSERFRYYADFGTLADVAQTLSKGFVYDGRFSLFRNKTHGKALTDASVHQLIGCLQNHDQIGNRALGERTSHLLSTDRLKMGAAMVLTSPFVPMLFQGEEWGAKTPFLYFTNHEDEELGNAVYNGRKKEFSDFETIEEEIPHPQSHETFMKSKLDWDELKQSGHPEILDWHLALIRLRREKPDLRQSRFPHIDFDEENQWLTLHRGSIHIHFNFNTEIRKIPLSDQRILIASKEGVKMDEGGIILPGNCVVIVENKD